jgi:hypothetical protein
MRTLRIRHAAAAGALALVAACGAGPQTPLPIQAASAEPVVVATGSPPAASRSSTGIGTSPAVRSPAGAKPTKTRTPKPGTTSDSPCFGAIQYDIDVPNTVLDLQQSMCFHTGGILRLKNIEPGLVESGPESVVSGSYEAGIETLRFIRPGTATVTIPQNDQIHTITVVVRA